MLRERLPILPVRERAHGPGVLSKKRDNGGQIVVACATPDWGSRRAATSCRSNARPTSATCSLVQSRRRPRHRMPTAPILPTGSWGRRRRSRRARRNRREATPADAPPEPVPTRTRRTLAATNADHTERRRAMSGLPITDHARAGWRGLSRPARASYRATRRSPSRRPAPHSGRPPP